MSRRYDSRTTIFSPEGRLYQVEYAMEAISHAGTVLGVTCAEGVILAAEKRVTSKLLDEGLANEKVYLIHDTMLCGVAGITADANWLINRARLAAQRYLYSFDTTIPAEELVEHICDVKQGYTQFGGLRPYGVSLLYACHDPDYGFQLYHSDPSGNYAGWKATCVGSNSSAATSMLKSEYSTDTDAPPMSMEDAFKLTMRVLVKTLDTPTLSCEKLEFATISKVNGKVVCKTYKAAEIDNLLKKYSPSAGTGNTASEE